MSSSIHIGNQISMKESAAPIADALVKVIQALAESRTDREVSIKALEIIGRAAAPISGVNISDCNFEFESSKTTDAAVYQEKD